MSGRAVTLLVASLFVSSCTDEGAPSGPFAPFEETAVAQSSATGVPGTTSGQAATQAGDAATGSSPAASSDGGTPTTDDAGEEMIDPTLPEEDGDAGEDEDGGRDEDGGVQDDAGETEPPVLPDPGMPCAVKAVYYERCVGCHSEKGKAGVSVVTRAKLIGQSAVFPEQTIAERTVARMRDAEKPMPPRGERVADREIAAIEAWIADGMPESTCAQ